MKAIKMMILAMLALLWLPVQELRAQEGVEMNCSLGFQYQLSYQNRWGANRPVIVRVLPLSPADEAGLKVGDIIETIDAQKVGALSEENMKNLFLSPQSSSVRLEVTNFGYQKKPIVLHKKCRPVNAIGEADLATAFAHYSLEDVADREFRMPFEISSEINVDFSYYKTFAIAPIDGQFNKIDRTMQRIIVHALEEKGLKQVDSKEAELLVRTFYSFDQNERYNPNIQQKPEGFHNYRYSCVSHIMQDFPFVPIASSDAIGRYIIKMGVSLQDVKTEKVVWKIEANERMYEPMTLETYAKEFLPLAFYNFPFLRYEKNPIYVYHKKRFSYSGLFFNTKNMKDLIYVEPMSPAEKAGLQAGDYIEAIDGVPTHSSPDVLVDSYKRFLTDSYELRDRDNIFVDANGYTRAMPWAPTKYVQVYDLLQQNLRKYKPVFSYLFSFRPYIAKPERDQHIFDLVRDGKKHSIVLQAKKLDLSYLELK